MDAHTPLLLKEFSGESTSQYAWLNEGSTNPLEKMFYSGGARIEMSVGDRAHMVNQYDDEVLYFDQSIGVLRRLNASGSTRMSIVVVAADHGEECRARECEALSHAVRHGDAYAADLPIPGFRPAGFARRRQRRHPAHAGRLRGDRRQPHEFEGISPASLRGVARGNMSSAQGPLRSVSDGRYHLIYELENESVNLDRIADPAETEDLSAREPGREGAGPRSRIGSLEGLGAAAAREEAIEKARVVEEHLKAIGYVD